MNPWDERFKEESYFYGETPNDFIKKIANTIPPNSHILCLAEGEGRNAVYLATLGHQVTALDISTEGLKKTELLAKKHNVGVETVHANLDEYVFSANAWNVIIAVFMHLPPLIRTKVFEAIPNALKRGGLFIGEFYRQEQLKFATGGPKDPQLLYSSDLIKTELSSLTFELINEVEREVVEGIGHTGHAAVLQIIARS
ncbi:MAG: Tellurite resistance protein TehB [Idiomarinaceae bacterium HL-53]|nr:MAG: Tellurite resistance protein TehB [Idiomarinaceae bacterium HL-53]CUS48875.1 Tellurite resistance protein TehB [Idiomarinaceae bacterium HL-53]